MEIGFGSTRPFELFSCTNTGQGLSLCNVKMWTLIVLTHSLSCLLARLGKIHVHLWRAEKVIKLGVNNITCGTTALWWASRWGKIEVLSWIVVVYAQAWVSLRCLDNDKCLLWIRQRRGQRGKKTLRLKLCFYYFAITRYRQIAISNTSKNHNPK